MGLCGVSGGGGEAVDDEGGGLADFDVGCEADGGGFLGGGGFGERRAVRGESW